MRRHEFLLAPSREDARKERKRTRRGGDLYHIEQMSPNANDMMIHCVAHHGSSPVLEDHDFFSCNQPFDQSSAKLFYLESIQTSLWDRLPPTWACVQQKDELEYNFFVDRLASLKQLRPQLSEQGRKILEEFDGFVDQFEGDVAHITLKTQSGEQFYGEYPASELKAQGIHERRRFKCWTVEVGNLVEFVMEHIPDREVSKERERQIDEWLQNSLDDDDVPQDDY